MVSYTPEVHNIENIANADILNLQKNNIKKLQFSVIEIRFKKLSWRRFKTTLSKEGGLQRNLI